MVSADLKDYLFDQCRGSSCKICLPEMTDPRVKEAADWLLEQKIVSEIVPDTLAIQKQFKHPALQDHPLSRAACLLSMGEVDVVVAGASYSTADVIRYALKIIPLEQKFVSSCFIFEKAQFKRFMFADAGVIIQPNIEQLVAIAQASVQTWQTLFVEPPVVSFLSFATKSSASHPLVDQLREACDQFKKLNPMIACDGPLQFDAAWDGAVGNRKGADSRVSGHTNLFIFPDLNAANIAYKIAQRLGGYQAYGPILQGFKLPYTDLSRGCTTEEIIISCLIQIRKALHISKKESIK